MTGPLALLPEVADTRRAVASATDVNAEKAMSAAASRACSRTRRGAGGVSVARNFIDRPFDDSCWCCGEGVRVEGFAGPGLRPLRCRLGPGKVSKRRDTVAARK